MKNQTNRRSERVMEGYQNIAYDPDKPGFGSALLVVIFNIGMCCSVFPWNMIGVLWPLIGISWVGYKIAHGARRYNSPMWTEFLVMLKVLDEVFISVYLWPLDMLTVFCNYGPAVTYRGALEMKKFDECFLKIAPASGRDNAIFAARDSFRFTMKKTEAQSKRNREQFEAVATEAQTVCACGATVVTLATTSASAESVEGMTAVTNIEVKSTGWVTAVYETPTEKERNPELRHTRIRTTVTAKPMPVSAYSEFDLAGLQYPKDNWAKQYLVAFRPAETVTINVGRMALSPVFLTPPPFLQETVNAPRTPFSVFAYATQVDVRIDDWRIIADVSGKSGLRFNEADQFDRLEGSARVERKLGKKLTVAITTQASEDFMRGSFDFSLKPAPWLDTKGAVHRADNRDTKGHQVTEGAYIYTGVRPFKEFRQLELHGQADFQKKPDVMTMEPVIVQGGARLLMDKGKHSLTLDYQSSPGNRNEKRDQVFLRWQTRF